MARKFSEIGTVTTIRLLHTMVQKHLKSTNTTTGYLTSLEGNLANYSNISVNSNQVWNTMQQLFLPILLIYNHHVDTFLP